MALSQEAYEKYHGELSAGGTLIIEEDLVKPSAEPAGVNLRKVPATRLAEGLGNRLFTNLVALGFLTAVTGLVSAEAMKRALPGLVPERFLKINIKAFEQGYRHGVETLGGAN